MDIAVLPEASLDGYASPELDFDLTRFAEPLDGPACRALSDLARRHGCHLAGSWVERSADRCFNAMTVFDPDGTRVAHYRKRHPWYPERWATPGDGAAAVFTVAGLRVTLAICFDVHFLANEAARELDQADVLLFPSAWVDEDGDGRAEVLPPLARAFDVAIVNANWGPGVPRVRGQGGSRILGPDGQLLAVSCGELRVDAELLGKGRTRH